MISVGAGGGGQLFELCPNVGDAADDVACAIERSKYLSIVVIAIGERFFDGRMEIANALSKTDRR